MQEILLFNNFFPIVDMPELRRYSPTNLWDGAQMAKFWRIFATSISASRL